MSSSDALSLQLGKRENGIRDSLERNLLELLPYDMREEIFRRIDGLTCVLCQQHALADNFLEEAEARGQAVVQAIQHGSLKSLKTSLRYIKQNHNNDWKIEQYPDGWPQKTGYLRCTMENLAAFYGHIDILLEARSIAQEVEREIYGKWPQIQSLRRSFRTHKSLMVAASAGQLKIIESLLEESQQDVHYNQLFGESLEEAVRRGHLDS